MSFHDLSFDLIYFCLNFFDIETFFREFFNIFLANFLCVTLMNSFQDVPKSFDFSNTGHALSPDDIVISKKARKTPVVPKTKKGRKFKKNRYLRGCTFFPFLLR